MVEVQDLGERALIELARRICKVGPPVKVGVGDDAAVVEIDGKYLVATTDMLVGHTHFPMGTPAKEMGWKAVVTNLSDLAAMGAEPLGLVFSVGLPRGTKADFVRELLRSMNSCARRYGTYVVGGDLNESGDVVISGTAFGTVPKGGLLTRSGARAGDIVAVTGELGVAAAGVKMLLEKLPKRGYGKLLEAYAKPTARVREGVFLARSGYATAAIDVTDGLAANLWQISRMSKVKLVVDYSKIPVSPQVRKFARDHGFDEREFVLFGGEDFELLFTVRRDGWEKVKRGLSRRHIKVSAIGEAVRGRGVYIRTEEGIEKMPDRGYEHFR